MRDLPGGTRRWLALGLGPLLLIVLSLAGAWPYTRSLDLDLLFWSRGAVAPRSPLTIVAVDEGALRALGARWPPSRSLHAAAIKNLAAAGARVIGMDVLFSEPSEEADDEALAAAIRGAGSVVLAAAISEDGQGSERQPVLVRPATFLGREAAGIGLINQASDLDNVLRRAALGLPYQDRVLPTLPVVLWGIARDRGLAVAPLPEVARIVVNFRGGPGTFTRLPFDRVVKNDFPPAAVRDRIVLVGVTAPSLRDLFRTPFARGGDMPGVEVLASATDTLVAGDDIRQPSTRTSVVLAVLASLLAGALVIWWPRRALAVTGALVVIVVVTGLLLFRFAHTAAPVVEIALGLAAGLLGSLIAR